MAYQYEKVNKKLLVPQIEDQLMIFISQDEIKIGEKLPNEYNLAERFGVGRSTVREAVKSLTSKGVLEVRRGAGTFVKKKEMELDDPLGLSKLEDKFKLAMELFDIRILLEPEVAALACQNASDEDKRQMKELCDEVERLYLAGKNHIQKDMEFHACIAKSSGNRVVEVLVPVIHTAVTTFANLTNRKLMKETIETHRDITNSILRSDPVGARCAMISHLTYNRRLLLQLLDEQDNRMEENKVV